MNTLTIGIVPFSKLPEINVYFCTAFSVDKITDKAQLVSFNGNKGMIHIAQSFGTQAPPPDQYLHRHSFKKFNVIFC